MRRRSAWIFAALASLLFGSLFVVVCIAGFRSALMVDTGRRVFPEPVSTEKFRAILARVRERVPEPAAFEDMPCPDEKIGASAAAIVAQGADDGARHLRTLSYESLAEFVDHGPTPLDVPPRTLWPAREDLGFEPEPDTSSDRNADWLFLDEVGLREVIHPNLYEGYYADSAFQRTIQQTLDDRYLGVLRASRRAFPRILNAGTPLDGHRWELRRGENFRSGILDGGIAIVDLSTGEIMCQARIEASSSSALGYVHRGSRSERTQNPKRLLQEDFRDRARQATRDALARITKVMR